MFAPRPDRGIAMPCYAYGHGQIKKPVFTCPVSAIPEAVWSLMELWLACRAMKALPYAGGVLDQPAVVRRAWPLFESANAPYDASADADRSMTAVATTLAMIFGRKR